MTNPQRRHDISDAAWALLEPHLPGQSGQWGVWQRIIASSSMPSSGYCVLARRGEICRRNMANGEPFTNALFVGERSEYGKNSLKC